MEPLHLNYRYWGDPANAAMSTPQALYNLPVPGRLHKGYICFFCASYVFARTPSLWTWRSMRK